ncbi:MAG: hypothetical protein OER88_06700, partial [Planctomycetota bacterium]|nr:hypothetical protein [Planctomycetota bacterium]
DCNFNGVADSCEIDSGAVADCNGNGIPDDCDVSDDFETDTGWTPAAIGDTAARGHWTRVDPNGTDAQPEDDHTIGAGRICFVTGQGPVGGGAGQDDVDGGTTTLVSPTYDLSADPDVEMAYWRWYSNDAGSAPNEDVFVIDISNDGGNNWTNVETVGPVDEASGGWIRHRFRVADFVTPTTQIVLRFVASDLGTGSIVEAAVDDLAIIESCCVPPQEIAGLAVDRPGPTRLTWSGQGAGVIYDVVSGDLATMRTAGNVDDATCQGDDLVASTWDDPRADPAAGSGFYYLVRAEECDKGGYGTSSSGAPREPTADCP